MKRVEVEAVEDRSRAEGGHAVILMRGIGPTVGDLRFDLRPLPIGDDEVATTDRPDLTGLTPLSVRETIDGLALSIGPDIVHNPLLVPGTAVEIVLPAAGIRGEFLWPAVSPIARPKRRNIMTRSTDPLLRTSRNALEIKSLGLASPVSQQSIAEGAAFTTAVAPSPVAAPAANLTSAPRSSPTEARSAAEAGATAIQPRRQIVLTSSVPGRNQPGQAPTGLGNERPDDMSVRTMPHDGRRGELDAAPQSVAPSALEGNALEPVRSNDIAHAPAPSRLFTTLPPGSAVRSPAGTTEGMAATAAEVLIASSATPAHALAITPSSTAVRRPVRPPPGARPANSERKLLAVDAGQRRLAAPDSNINGNLPAAPLPPLKAGSVGGSFWRTIVASVAAVVAAQAIVLSILDVRLVQRRDVETGSIVVANASPGAKATAWPSAAPAVADTTRRPSAAVGAVAGVPAIYELIAAGSRSPRGYEAESVLPAEALEVAHALLHGDEERRDPEEAAFWLKRYLASASGVESVRIALTQLGSAYALPVNGRQEFARARLVWELSSALGDPVAMCFLGAMHEHGLGTSIAPAEAAVWYARASALGRQCSMAGRGG